MEASVLNRWGNREGRGCVRVRAGTIVGDSSIVMAKS